MGAQLLEIKLKVRATPRLLLPQLLDVFPARHWVTAAEVRDKLGAPQDSLDGVGAALGRLCLCRTQVHIGKRIARVWLIRGVPEDFQPSDVRRELLEHGFPAPERTPRGVGRSRVVNLTELSPKNPPSPAPNS
jgi:hypothetical protein